MSSTRIGPLRVLICAALSLAACSNAPLQTPDAGPTGVGGAAGGVAGSTGGSGGSVGTGGSGGGAGTGGGAGAGGVTGAGGGAGAGGPSGTGGGAGAAVCSRGGSGGTAGIPTTGTAGTSEQLPCQTFPGVSDCPASGPVCGNSVRDTCIRTASSGRCPRYSFTEPCDGNDGVGAYCTSLGFGSGNVACSASCTFDTSGCQECAAIAAVVRCGPAPMTTAQPLAMAIGATDAEVGLAWSEQVQGQAPTLHFARLSPSLDLVGATMLTDDAFAAAVGGLAVPPVLAVAPLPAGWIVAGYAAPDLFVHAIDATGKDVGRLVVATIPPSEAIAGVPILAARPDGGPLVVWVQGAEVRAAVVAADGRSKTASVALSTAPSRVLGSPSAVYAGSAFAVAFTVDGGASQRRLHLAGVGTDGSLGGAVDALPGVNIGSATLGPPQVLGSNDLTVIHSPYVDPCVTDQRPPIYAQRISSTGAPLGDTVPVGRAGQYDGWAQSGAFTTSAFLLLLRESGSRNTLGVGWLKPLGKEFGVAAQIAVDPALTFRSLNIVRRGNDGVAAWLAPPRPGIRIARLTP